MTKRTFLAVLTAGLLSACTTGIFYNGVQELSVSFVQPSEWDGKVFPAVQTVSAAQAVLPLCSSRTSPPKQMSSSLK